MSESSEAVIIRIKLSDDEFGEPSERQTAYDVEDKLLDAVPSDLGEVDGHEFGEGYAVIYLYGPSAETLAARVLPILSSVSVRMGSTITKRFGPPGANEETTPWP